MEGGCDVRGLLKNWVGKNKVVVAMRERKEKTRGGGGGADMSRLKRISHLGTNTRKRSNLLEMIETGKRALRRLI